MLPPCKCHTNLGFLGQALDHQELLWGEKERDKEKEKRASGCVGGFSWGDLDGLGSCKIYPLSAPPLPLPAPAPPPPHIPTMSLENENESLNS